MTRRRLLSWLDEPSAHRGIRFAARDDCWDLWSYERLATAARRAACGLVERGVGRNDVVVLVQRSGPEFVAALYGTMLAGAVPAPAAPPAALRDRPAYRDHLSNVMRAAAPALVVADADLVAPAGEVAVAAAAGSAPVATVGLAEIVDAGGEAGRDPGRPAADLALLQFTSGSSGRARGVRVPFDALEANVEAIRRWLRMAEDDATASWLPVHHDLGLIGCVLTPAANRSDVWLLRPGDFVRRPLRYLSCFGALGARLTAMPGFGLEHIASRVHPDQLDGLDFSEWRAVIVGAERLDAGSLERFHRLLAPRGFRRTALLPAYGLAEATLAVTGVPLEEEWRSTRVEPASLSPGRRVEEGTGETAAEVVGCGRPVAGASVAVVDDGGRPLPDGHVGVIVAGGASVAAGYATELDSASLTAFTGDGVRTGDAGFVLDGQLFVLGRLGDSTKIRAGTVFAEDLEASLVAAGLPARRVAVVLGLHLGAPTAVAVLEQPHESWPEVARGLLRRRCEGGEVVVVSAPRGVIARTSSGKPRRGLIWRAFVGGALQDGAGRSTRS